MQAPNWTDFLQCSVCTNKFDQSEVLPITLTCGHTLCTRCLSKLKTRMCPYDKAVIRSDAESLPPNPPLLELLGYQWTPPTVDDAHVLECDLKNYIHSVSTMIELAKFLQPLADQGITAAATHLTKPMLKKLVTVVNCQVLESEGQARALRAARSIGDRAVTELLVMHQNQQQISTLLWTAVRNRGCQFLGPIMQEEALKLILIVLQSGNSLSRKNIVLFVVQRLSNDFPQASKTSVGHVVQLLYRASCFNVEKRDDDSSLMQLKEEFRSYDCLRREHDSQIIRMAMEAGLRISPEQWSTLLYGDHKHKSDMQSIIDKLISQGAASSGLSELIVAIGRSQDPYKLSENIVPHLEAIFKVQVNPDKSADILDWDSFATGMEALLGTLQGFSMYMQIQSGRYKTGLCPHLSKPGGCPKGEHCTYAHSEEERERYRNLVKPTKPSKPRSGDQFSRSGSLNRLSGGNRGNGRYSGDLGPVKAPPHDSTPHSSLGSLERIPSGPNSMHDHHRLQQQQSYSDILHYQHHSGEPISGGLRHSGPITAPVLPTNQDFHNVQRGVATVDHTYRATDNGLTPYLSADQVYHQKSLQHSEPVAYGVSHGVAQQQHLSKLDLLRLHHEAVKQSVEANTYAKELLQTPAAFSVNVPYSQGEWLATNQGSLPSVYSQSISDPFQVASDEGIMDPNHLAQQHLSTPQQHLLSSHNAKPHILSTHNAQQHILSTSSAQQHPPSAQQELLKRMVKLEVSSYPRVDSYTTAVSTATAPSYASNAVAAGTTIISSNPAGVAEQNTTSASSNSQVDLEAEISRLKEQLREQEETILQQKVQLHYNTTGGVAHPQSSSNTSTQYIGGAGQQVYSTNGLVVGDELIHSTPSLLPPQAFNYSAQHLQAAAVAVAAALSAPPLSAPTLSAPIPGPQWTASHYSNPSGPHATPTGTGYVVQPPQPTPVLLHPAARPPPPQHEYADDSMLAAYVQVMEQTKAAASGSGYQATPTYNPPTQTQYYYRH